MSSVARRSGDDSSSHQAGSGAGRGVSAARRAGAAAVVAGAAAAVLATFLPVLRVAADRELVPALDRSGWDLHGPALIALALLAVVALPAAVRGAVAAALAICVSGLVVLGLAVLDDLPDVGTKGLVGADLLEGVTRAGAGAYVEVLAGVLLVLGGGVLALLREH
jgi:hypothetical protein